jgi:hypothetical protein
MNAQERLEIIRRARELAASPPVRESAAEKMFDARQRERALDRDDGGLSADEARRVRAWLDQPVIEPAPAQSKSWWEWVDERVEYLLTQRLEQEREFILEVVGTALGEYTAELTKQDGKQLRVDEVRALILELSNTRDEMRELRSHLPGGEKSAERPGRAAH